MNRRRVAAFIAGLAVLAAGCGADAPDATALLEDGPSTLDPVECPPGMPDGTACATLDVALDPANDPAGPTTAVSFAVVAGEDDALPPLVVLQGGPGGASTGLARFLPRQPFAQVFIDQRGTGFGPVDFDCPEFDAVLPDLVSLPVDEIEVASDAALGACAARLADDPLLEHTDTANHAADIAAVMDALGFERWVSYGVSYGSTIGFELLRQAPDGLVGVVLDGVYPLDLDTDAGVARSASAAATAVTRACSADATCSGFTDDFAGLLDRLIEGLDAEPRTVALSAGESGFGVPVDVRLDGTRLAEFVFQLLYSENLTARLPATLAQIEDGDADAARWLAATASRSLAGAYGANDEATYFAVQCQDRLPDTGGDPGAGADTRFAEAVVPIPLTELCPVWDVEPGSGGAAVTSDLPTLLLSGAFDPITPEAYAIEAAAGLSNSTLVTQGGRGHGIWIGNDCIGAIVESFVADPLAELDTSCAAEGAPVDWRRP